MHNIEWENIMQSDIESPEKIIELLKELKLQINGVIYFLNKEGYKELYTYYDRIEKQLTEILRILGYKDINRGDL